MKLNHLLATIMILVVPFIGMAQTEIAETEADLTINNDSSTNVPRIEAERDTDLYRSSQHSEDEYIYVTEYEEEKKWFDRVITRLLKTSVDSNYITTNDYGLQVKLSLNTLNTQTNFRWTPISDTLPNFCSITSDQISKIGLWVGYRNFGLGYSFDLGSFTKEYNSEFSISYYGDAWGIDLFINTTLGNNLYFNEKYTDISDVNISIFRWRINSYYAPLYKKFSYNAAFSHSMRQEKSAGSPLFGLSTTSFYLIKNKYGKNKKLPIVTKEEWQFPDEIYFFGLNLNAGYAHNFVTPKKTLLHISALPYITLFRITGVNPSDAIGDHDPKFQYGLVGKASWIWQREHHLISLFGSVNFNNIIKSPIKVNDTSYSIGTCYGFRAYKHCKPHKKKRIKRNRTTSPTISQ